MIATKKRVLITGASGNVGRSLAEQLKDRYELRLQYHHTIPDERPTEDYVVADIADYDAIAPALAGMDAVVHTLAGMDAVVHMAADSSTSASWESVRDGNIIGTYNVIEAARRAGVRKVIFASTNHVMGMYDRDQQWPVYANQPVRPDSLYGVSKAFGEALGRHYSDQYGLSVICLRIGWFLPEPHNEIAHWMWLSPRDGAQVTWRAIESDLTFGIFYAISANSSRHWDITDTMEKLGYRPEDDAQRFLAERARAQG